MTTLTPALRWSTDARGSLHAESFSIRPSRVGFTWELWRYDATRGSEALGMGTQEELQAVAERLAPWHLKLRPLAESRSSFGAATMPKAPAKKSALTRAWDWLNS